MQGLARGNRPPLAPVAVTIFTVCMLLLGALSVATRLAVPWDGSEWYGQPGALFGEGVGALPAAEHSVLLPGDVVRSVNGIQLVSLPRGPFDVASLPSSPLEYEIVSAAGVRFAEQPLAAFPAELLLREDWAALLVISLWLVIAAFVFVQLPRDPAAQLLLVLGAIFVPGMFWRWVGVSDLYGGPVVMLLAAYQPLYLLGVAGVLAMVVVFPRPWPWAVAHRRLLTGAIVAPVIAVLAITLHAQLVGERLYAWGGRVAAVEGITYGVALIGLLVGLPLRYRALTEQPERRSFALVIGSMAVMTAATLLIWIAPANLWGAPLLPWSTVALVALPLPFLLGFSILRYGAFDLQRVINRSLVYGGATAAIALIYVGLVGIAVLLVHEQFGFAVALLSTALVILIAQPIRDALQRAVNRLMYGDRDDPYRGIARLGQQLDSAIALQQVPDLVVDTVATSLRLPYAAVVLGSDGTARVVAQRGVAVNAPLTVPLVHQAETIGHLLLAPRNGEDSFSASDERLLTALATQVSAALRAAQLDAELQHSREQLVATREEERRRLRRDLHDGIGPTLAGSLLRLQAVRSALVSDPDRAAEQMSKLEDETRDAIAEVRRITRELRPPALDDLGLAGALRERALNFSAGPELEVQVQVPEDLAPLPAAVEVAAYRIAVEAMSNAARHARARNCWVSLEVADNLRLRISDDGTGLHDGFRAGVGLRSMRERAEELGGSVTFGERAGGGTEIDVRLPFGIERGG